MVPGNSEWLGLSRGVAHVHRPPKQAHVIHDTRQFIGPLVSLAASQRRPSRGFEGQRSGVGSENAPAAAIQALCRVLPESPYATTRATPLSIGA
jgi:hypothetical protein